MKREMTAKEFLEQLEKDPDYQARSAEKERQWTERIEMLRRDQQPLIAALLAKGWPVGVRQGGEVRSVWDFVNTAEPYPHLLETFAEHIQRPYNPDTLNAIARALTVREARGTQIPKILLEQLKKQIDPPDGPTKGYREGLINALALIGDPSMAEEVRQLMEDPRFAEVRKQLQRVAKAIQRADRRVPNSDPRHD